MRQSTSISSFKAALKAHLFKSKRNAFSIVKWKAFFINEVLSKNTSVCSCASCMDYFDLSLDLTIHRKKKSKLSYNRPQTYTTTHNKNTDFWLIRTVCIAMKDEDEDVSWLEAKQNPCSTVFQQPVVAQCAREAILIIYFSHFLAHLSRGQNERRWSPRRTRKAIQAAWSLAETCSHTVHRGISVYFALFDIALQIGVVFNVICRKYS